MRVQKLALFSVVISVFIGIASANEDFEMDMGKTQGSAVDERALNLGRISTTSN